ncbi:MAG: PAS domain S-box protein [Phycisphaerae bacterium]|nr:PAS domain S-box protein [Phycisphaerae bacterium]
METAIRVLIVEDSPDDAERMLIELRRGGLAPEFRRVDNRQAMLDALRRESWDIVLCSHAVPGLGPDGALALVKEMGLDSPFIIISSGVGEECAVAALRVGRRDYVVKSDLKQLAPVVKRALLKAGIRREREQPEQALLRSEKLLRHTFEAIPGLLTVHDRALRVVLSNWHEHEYVTWEDRSGAPYCYVCYMHRDRPCEPCYVLEVFASGKPKHAEMTNSVDGRTREINAYPVFDESGDVVLVAQHVRDITDRKRAEEALRESEEFGSTLLNDSPNPIIVINSDGSIRYVNAALEKLTGFSSEELDGVKIPYPWWVKGTERRVANDFKIALRQGAQKLEERFQRRNGELFWVEITGTPVRSGGEFKYYLANWVDITERKRAEEALRRSEARLRQVAENAREWVWEVDADGLYTYASPVVETILGYEPEELVGKKHFYDLFHPDDREELRKETAVAFADGLSFSAFINRNVGKDGRIVWLSTSGTPVLDEHGNLTGYRGADTDVTWRKLAEEEAQKRQAEMAHVSRLNTMGELASGLAHELNQPLCAISSCVQACLRMLKSGAGNSEEVTDAMEDVVEQAERAGEIIRRLRNFVRKQEPKRAQLNINEVVEETVAFVEGEARRHDTAIRLELAERMPSVLADSIQIQQVVVNLARNGIEAISETEAGQGEIVISTSSTDGEMVTVAVRDTGRGLPPEELEQVFESFYTTKPQGLGLGLPLSRSIIEAHGGRLWVAPNPDQGVTFQFTLPVSTGVGDDGSRGNRVRRRR